MNFSDIPNLTPKQAKYSEQYRRMIERYRCIRDTFGFGSYQDERAFRRLMQAKQILERATTNEFQTF